LQVVSLLAAPDGAVGYTLDGAGDRGFSSAHTTIPRHRTVRPELRGSGGGVGSWTTETMMMGSDRREPRGMALCRSLVAFLIVILGPQAIGYFLIGMESDVRSDVARTLRLSEAAFAFRFAWKVLVYPHDLAWVNGVPLLPGRWAPILALFQWSAVGAVAVWYSAQRRVVAQLAINLSAVLFVGSGFLLLNLALGVRFAFTE
jgi:hypothetical protein